MPIAIICSFLLYNTAIAVSMKSVTPNYGKVGSTLDIIIEVSDPVVSIPFTVSFVPSADITVNSSTYINLTKVSANITIGINAQTGPRDVILDTGGWHIVGDGMFNVVKPTIDAVIPGSGVRGQTLDIDIFGSYTSFSGTSVVSFSGGGITVNSVTFFSSTHLKSNISISSSAEVGSRNITVTTGSEVVTGYDLFNVKEKSISVTPSSGVQGDLLSSVVITGYGTNFNSGTTVDLGPRISYSSKIVSSPTSITLTDVSIALNAKVGPRDVAVITGSEVVVADNGFTVIQGPNTKLLSIVPSVIDAGIQNFTVTLTGQNTNFEGGVSKVTFSGSGVKINSIKVLSETVLDASITIDGDAIPGQRDVAVETGYEKVTLVGALNVTPHDDVININPASAWAEDRLVSNVTISVTGSNGLSLGSSTLVFLTGTGVTVDPASIVIISPDMLKCNISMAPDARGNIRDVIVQDGTQAAYGKEMFDVINPDIDRIVPSTGKQGTTLIVNITGIDTNFNSYSRIDFGEGIAINRMDVQGPLEVETEISISNDAPAGYRTVTVTTPGAGRNGRDEIVTGEGLFYVTPAEEEGCGCNTNRGGINGTVIFILLVGFIFLRGKLFFAKGFDK